MRSTWSLGSTFKIITKDLKPDPKLFFLEIIFLLKILEVKKSLWSTKILHAVNRGHSGSSELPQCQLRSLMVKKRKYSILIKSRQWNPQLMHFYPFNRYTTDEKSSLHTWRGAWAPFRSVQLLRAMNIFESQILRKRLFLNWKIS